MSHNTCAAGVTGVLSQLPLFQTWPAPTHTHTHPHHTAHSHVTHHTSVYTHENTPTPPTHTLISGLKKTHPVHSHIPIITQHTYIPELHTHTIITHTNHHVIHIKHPPHTYPQVNTPNTHTSLHRHTDISTCHRIYNTCAIHTPHFVIKHKYLDKLFGTISFTYKVRWIPTS